jgi:hypothetical protein
MRPSAPIALFSSCCAVLLILSICQVVPQGALPVTGNPASPRNAAMCPAKSILRLVVSRQPVAYCTQPERGKYVLDFLSAYVIETLECGHQVEQFFNPPIEPLIAKRRRCVKCVPNVIEFPTRDASQRKAA